MTGTAFFVQIIKAIGPERFVALLSDNTGNARKGRELTVEVWQHIFNLQDAVHEQQLTILEITKLTEFEEVSNDSHFVSQRPAETNASFTDY